MVVNIQDDILKLHAMGLLSRLLQDKATRGSILWATDAYAHQGDGYSRGNEIRPQRITGENSDLIKTRARRAMEQRTERTRQHAEVFTPLWIVKKMCDAADAEWFGRKDGFWKRDEAGHICFPVRRTWKHYVDARRMEITCGEAPFLVTRYDVETGEAIPVEDRIGLLDRKLRTVSENAKDLDEWKTWALRAAQATYGYELQGDNLLIARVNLLCSVEEHMFYRWRQKPDKPWLEKLCNVIAWNLWQMDGIKGCVPVPPKPTEEQLCLFPPEPQFEQGNLFGDTKETEITCRLFDWRGDHSISYQTLREKGLEVMKFDFIIGNPPYQEMDNGAGASATPIYHKFIEEAKKTDSEVISLIIPAKWYSGGKGLNDFRKAMLNDRCICRLVDYTSSLDCFPNVDVAGGVCFFVRKKSHDGDCLYTNNYNGKETTIVRNLSEFETFVRYPIAVQIIHKVREQSSEFLSSVVSSRKPFGLATDVKPTETGDIKLRYNGGIGLYQSSKICVGKELIDKHKVMISYLSAEHAGQPDKSGRFRVLSTMELLPPKAVCTETYLIAGSFDTKEEAENMQSYLKTKFVRFLIAQMALSQHITKNSFCFVPCQNFKKGFSDQELYNRYHLSADEISFIEGMIKEMS